jgi:hypothetical protein
MTATPDSEASLQKSLNAVDCAHDRTDSGIGAKVQNGRQAVGAFSERPLLRRLGGHVAVGLIRRQLAAVTVWISGVN